MSFDNTEQIAGYEVLRKYATNNNNGAGSIIKIRTATLDHGIFTTFQIVFGTISLLWGFAQIGTGQAVFTPLVHIGLAKEDFVAIMAVLSSGKPLQVIYGLTLNPFDPINQGKISLLTKFDVTSDVTITPQFIELDPGKFAQLLTRQTVVEKET